MDILKFIKNIKIKVNMFEYKGFTGSCEYSREDECYHGRILKIKDSMNYEGESIEETKEEFKKTVEYYLSITKC